MSFFEESRFRRAVTMKIKDKIILLGRLFFIVVERRSM